METDVRVREIGVPVRCATHVMLFAGSDAEGKSCLYVSMGQVGAPFFVLAIDPATGACTKHLADVEAADEAVSAFWSERHKLLFAGSCYAGHLHQFNPQSGRLEDLGVINAGDPAAANFPCHMDEYPDGALYIGSYGKCDLTRYNPETGKFTNFGRMDDVDMYFYPRCGVDGTVAGLVKMTRPHVVAFDPETGEHRSVGPVADVDRQIGSVELIKGNDGLLYIKSHEGKFRISGMELVEVETVPEPMPRAALLDGSTFKFLDAAQFEHRELEISHPDGSRDVFHLDWQGDGTNLFFCHLGPDAKVYGSSMLPEHLFSCDPKTDECIDHGACSTSGGEAYSMGNLDGKLYIASYPAAKLSVYDPAKPWRFGTDPDANPRELGRMDEVAYRPRAMVAGPAGKVWVASIPDYGMWGGTLAWYDPKTGEFGSHRHVVRDCSGYAMTYLPEQDLLFVGFAVEGGTGTQPKAERAALVLWDPNADQEVWQGDLGLNINTVFDLCAAPGGLVYALILENGEDQRPTLWLIDPKDRAVVSSCVLTDPPHGWAVWGMQSLFIHRGYVYGPTYLSVFRAPLGTTDVEAYWITDDKNAARGGGAVVGGQWYFPTKHRLRALCLPG